MSRVHIPFFAGALDITEMARGIKHSFGVLRFSLFVCRWSGGGITTDYTDGHGYFRQGFGLVVIAILILRVIRQPKLPLQRDKLAGGAPTAEGRPTLQGLRFFFHSLSYSSYSRGSSGSCLAGQGIRPTDLITRRQASFAGGEERGHRPRLQETRTPTEGVLCGGRRGQIRSRI